MTISSFFVSLSGGSLCAFVLLVGGVILTARILLCAACPT